MAESPIQTSFSILQSQVMFSLSRERTHLGVDTHTAMLHWILVTFRTRSKPGTETACIPGLHIFLWLTLPKTDDAITRLNSFLIPETLAPSHAVTLLMLSDLMKSPFLSPMDYFSIACKTNQGCLCLAFMCSLGSTFSLQLKISLSLCFLNNNLFESKDFVFLAWSIKYGTYA